jgi:hypothetical protein
MYNLKQGEKKNIVFQVKDADGQLMDLSSATCFLGVKSRKSDTSYVFSKNDTSFNKSNAALGEVSVLLSDTDTSTAGRLFAELKVTFGDGTIEKSTDFFLYIEQSVT